MNWSLPIFLAFFATGSVLEAAIFSGSLKTKHRKSIAFCKLTARPETGSDVQFDSDRSGNFSVELGEGEWTLSADVEQIQAWGFSQMNGVSIAITGDMNVTNNLTLFASEPLQTPSLAFSRPDSRTWKFSVNGQGGTIVKIYSSTDMVTWTPYNAVAIGTTGVSISTATDSHKYVSSIYFRATASSE
jgi:hypothetical protein